MNSEDLVIIGKVLKPHGIKGEMRVFCISSFPERFKVLKNAYLSLNEKMELLEVESARFHKNFILLKFKGIDKIEEAEKWRGAEILIEEKDIFRKDENFYYYHELIGLPCFLPDGKFLGKVTAIEEGPLNVNLIIEEEDGFKQSIPFSKKFLEIERGKKIIVKPIPGLLLKK